MSTNKNKVKEMKYIQVRTEFNKRTKKRSRKNCEYVGENFEKEARAIHYGESPERSIYGKTTLNQAKSLCEDGIPVHFLGLTETN